MHKAGTALKARGHVVPSDAYEVLGTSPSTREETKAADELVRRAYGRLGWHWNRLMNWFRSA